MKKEISKSKGPQVEIAQVIRTDMAPMMGEITMMVISQLRGNDIYVAHWFFADENYAKAEMQKDIEKFKQAYLHGTYEIVKEAEDEVIIKTNNIDLTWNLIKNRRIEIEGKTYLKIPNRYNQTYKCIDEEY